MGRWEPLVAPEIVAELESPLAINARGRADLGRGILATIATAKQSLRIMSPMLDDPQIESALIAARMRRVSVKVITGLLEDRKKSPEFPSSEKGDVRIAGAVRNLTTKRIYCRAMGYFPHAKLVFADDQVAWVSSANLASNSLGWGQQSSIEAGLKIEETTQVASLVASFDRLWSACSTQLILDGADVSMQNVSGSKRLSSIDLDRDMTGLETRWSWPPGGRGLRDRLVDVINGARRRLILAALTLYDTDSIGGFHEALVKALSRGVAVDAVVRPEHFEVHQYPDRDPGVMDLIRRGMRLVGVTGLHAKGILSDEAVCGLMTANFNAYSLDSFVDTAHVECGIFGAAGSPMFQGFSRFLASLPAAATHAYRLEESTIGKD